MTDHIILNAFGTTTAAQQNYQHLGNLIAPHFPNCQLHWTYSSPTIRTRTAARDQEQSRSIAEIIEHIASDEPVRIVVQSMHILPGYEFHRVVRETQALSVPTKIGMPLLHDPNDFVRVVQCLQPLLQGASDEAILVLGHGTDHPSWTAFAALETELRRQAGSPIFVATLEKFPGSADEVIKLIAEGGFNQVKVIPFLLVAGMHFQRDIIGENELSWKNRLKRLNIRLDLYEHGLAMLPGIAEIFCDHIQSAYDSMHV